MRLARSLLFILFALATFNASGGSKRLVVAFFDYTEEGFGRLSFKSLRAAQFEHPCWQRFVEIQGIEKAFIERSPKSLDPAVLLDAVHGSSSAAKRFARLLKSEGMDGAYAFLLDSTGAYATVHGIHYHEGAITASAAFRTPKSGLIDPTVLSKAICEASKSMD